MLLVTIVMLAPTIAIPLIRHLDFTSLPKKPGFIVGVVGLTYGIIMTAIAYKDKKRIKRLKMPRLAHTVSICLALFVSLCWLGATGATIGLWVV